MRTDHSAAVQFMTIVRTGYSLRIRKGWIFWQGRWSTNGKIGVSNGHTYRAFTRYGIISRLHRVRHRRAAVRFHFEQWEEVE